MQPSSSYLSQYQTFTNNRTKPEDYVKRYSADLGVEDAKARVKSARSAIKSTEDTIAATPDSVSGRTSGSLVTDSQRNRLVQNEIAPMQEVLRTQGGAFSEATGDLSALNADLNSKVDLAVRQDESQANSLLTLYQAAMEAEKLAEQKRQYEADAAERIRQFNANLAESRRASSAFSPSFGASASAGGAKPAAVMTQKSNGSGFAFADSGGQPISAAKYAELTGQDIRSVLYSMGQKGDTYAAQVYNQLRNDPFFGKGDANYDARVKATYSPLFWGTGGAASSSGIKVATPLNTSTVKVSNPQSTAKVSVVSKPNTSKVTVR